MRAGQLMSPGVLAVSQDATIFEAAELMVSAEVSALPVFDSGGLMVGILSEADLMRRAEIGTEPHKPWLLRLFEDSSASAANYVHLHSHRVADVMTRDVVTVDEDTPLSEVAELMSRRNVKRIPVLRGQAVVGMISRSSLVRALLSRDPHTPAAQPSDDALRREVEAAVNGRTWSSPWPINVLVSGGTVHLWGFVDSDASAQAYRVAAENVPGVAKVKNHLRRIPATVGMGI